MNDISKSTREIVTEALTIFVSQEMHSKALQFTIHLSVGGKYVFMQTMRPGGLGTLLAKVTPPVSLRFYQGLTPALLQGPLSRFCDTAANTGVMALVAALPLTHPLVPPIQPDFFF